MINPTINEPFFVVLSDSHGKYLQSKITTQHYHISTQSISGLQWINKYDRHLCARSILASSSFTSILSQCTGIVFLIGTNSVRSTHALHIIEQIEDIITVIRLHHGHLTHKHGITIVETFPCYKTSARFPSSTLLSNNIASYNNELQILSVRMNFSCINFQITHEHLHHDKMHLQHQYKHLLYDAVITYFNTLIEKRLTGSQSRRRSRTAITRRNKKRHEKSRAQQQQHTLIRSISPLWKLADIKQLLKHHGIKFARLPEIYNHQLRIQFNNEVFQQQAEQSLSSTIFDEQHYIEWRRQHQ